MKKNNPAIIRIIPSTLENLPSIPKSSGKDRNNKYRNSLLITSLLTFTPLNENKAIKPKTKVKSVTFEPSKVPKPSAGFPFNEDRMAIAASGNTEITETMINETMKPEIWRVFANFEEDLIAQSELFTKRYKDTINAPKLNNTILFINSTII